MTKLIQLTRGYHAIVDDDDYAWMIELRWHSGNKARNYVAAGRSVNGKTIPMSREVISRHPDLFEPLLEGLEVDHINGDPLDNRKCNLRVCSHHENIFNRSRVRRVSDAKVPIDPRIQIGHGQFAEVDPDDYRWLVQYRWFLQTTGYAVRNIIGTRGRMQLMHRMIAEAYSDQFPMFPGCVIDHADGNPLNNRKSNLRVASRKQNSANMGISRRNISGVKGVCWHSASGKWMARLGNKYLGVFETKEFAGEVYANAISEKFGVFARITNEV